MKGKDLRKLRVKKGWTQQELGDKAGLTKRTIINYEQSENIPKSKANIFHFIFLDTFLDDENDTPEQIRVNDPSEVYPTKSGNIIEELQNGKYLLTVAMVPFRAHATYISEFQDADYISDFSKVSFIVDRVPRGKYRAFEIKNDSMNDATLEKLASRDAILDGDIVLGRELGKQHWTSKLNTNGYPYWIIVHKDTIVCKEIINHDVEKGIITCHSLNSSPEFQDFDLKLDECHQLFNIIKKQI
ncbi:helix-turn-helix domain-containing protein [Psychroserpens sp.]